MGCCGNTAEKSKNEEEKEKLIKEKDKEKEKLRKEEEKKEKLRKEEEKKEKQRKEEERKRKEFIKNIQNKLDYIPIKIEKYHFKDEQDKENEVNNKNKCLLDEEKKQFNEDALKEINIYRKLHGAEDLKFDEFLCQRAFNLSKQFLTEGTFDNSNLLYKQLQDVGLNTFESEEELAPKQLMSKWYEESNGYNFKEPDESKCYNFTQMIWKNSKMFGIGYYFMSEKNDISNNNQSKKYFYSALFFPAGNEQDKYKENVKEKIEKKKKDQSNDIAPSKENKSQVKDKPNNEGEKHEEEKQEEEKNKEEKNEGEKHEEEKHEEEKNAQKKLEEKKSEEENNNISFERTNPINH